MGSISPLRHTPSRGIFSDMGGFKSWLNNFIQLGVAGSKPGE